MWGTDMINNTKLKWHLVASAMCCLLATGGCRSSAPAGVDTSLVATPLELALPTAKLTTVLSTTTPTAIVMLSATATARPIPTPTWTIAPTGESMSAGEQQDAIELLWETNGGCEFPCWWGITPGETTVNDVIAELSPFSTVYLLRRPSGDLAALKLEFPAVAETEMTQGATLSLTDGYVQFVEVRDVGFQAGLSLPDVFGRWGIPTNVLIMTYSEPFNSMYTTIPFEIYLYYPARGALIGYPGTATRVGEMVKGCIGPDSRPLLGLWSPQTALSDEQALERIGLTSGSVLDFAESVDMSLEEFVESSAHETTTCLLTRAALWSNR